MAFEDGALRTDAEIRRGKPLTIFVDDNPVRAFAGETVAALDGPFDMVFIDADKENYVNYWDAVLPKVRPGGLLVADNVLWSGRVLEPKEASDKAIVAYRKLLRSAIDQMGKGERPIMVLDEARAASITGPAAIDGIGPIMSEVITEFLGVERNAAAIDAILARGVAPVGPEALPDLPDAGAAVFTGTIPIPRAAAEADEVNASMLPWLKQNEGRDDYFLWTNYWDPHRNYTLPREWFDRMRQHPCPVAWPDDEAIRSQKRDMLQACPPVIRRACCRC